MSVLELWIVLLTLVVLLSRMLSQKENGHARLCSCRIQLFGDFGKDIHLTCETKPIHSRKLFHECSPSSSRDCNEHKICLHFNGSFTENPFWYQQFDLRQIVMLRGGQPFLDFDTADNCRLYVTTMKAMNFQDDIPSIPINDFKDHYVVVFVLTSMQDATENCHYPELAGEPLRLELSFTQPLENLTKLIVLGERMSSVAFDNFGVVYPMLLHYEKIQT